MCDVVLQLYINGSRLDENTPMADSGSTIGLYENKGGAMKGVVFVVGCFVVFGGCSPKQTQGNRELQTFSPVMIDITKVEAKDYAELVAAVNTTYSPDKKEFVDARFLKEEAMFIYVHVYSGATTGCFRVTVDKNRSRIVNMQPDCSIEDE